MTAPAEPFRLGATMTVLLLEQWALGIMESRAPNEVIARNGPYIERWYLARKAMVPVLGGPVDEARAAANGVTLPRMPSELENLYLHRYVRSDAEHMHDHPWANATLVLSGWIREQTPAGDRRLYAGDVVLRPADALHAIREVAPGTITLFATLRKERDWGFLGEEGWVPWQDYRPMFRDAQVAA